MNIRIVVLLMGILLLAFSLELVALQYILLADVNGTLVFCYNNTVVHVSDNGTVQAKILYNVGYNSIQGVWSILIGAVAIILAYMAYICNIRSNYVQRLIHPLMLFGIGSIIFGTSMILYVYSTIALVAMVIGFIISAVYVIKIIILLLRKHTGIIEKE